MNKMKTKHHTALSFSSLLAIGLVVSSCGNRTTAPGGDALPAGAYTLVSVNGSRLPATVSHQGTSLDVRSGTLIFNDDGTCRSETTFAPASGNEIHRVVSASYSRQGSELTMRWKGAGTTRATIGDHALTMINEGIKFEYTR